MEDSVLTAIQYSWPPWSKMMVINNKVHISTKTSLCIFYYRCVKLQTQHSSQTSTIQSYISHMLMWLWAWEGLCVFKSQQYTPCSSCAECTQAGRWRWWQVPRPQLDRRASVWVVRQSSILPRWCCWWRCRSGRTGISVLILGTLSLGTASLGCRCRIWG